MQKEMPHLKHSGAEILSIDLNYGMGPENPILRCRFFTKAQVDVPFVVKQDWASKMHPIV